MDTIQEAIDTITYSSEKFPAEAFRFISNHPEEAKPYLHETIDRVVQEKSCDDVDYILPLYSLFFLGEFEDRDFFEHIMAFSQLPSELLDDFIGDAITEGLADVLYNTYNGNLQLLKDTIVNQDVHTYARMGMLDVIGQLYLDQEITRQEMQSYLRELISMGEDLDFEIYTRVLYIICRCHFVDMRSDLYILYEEDLVDTYFYGDYDDCIDMMFDYTDDENFCISGMMAEKLKSWAMFTEKNEDDDEEDEPFSTEQIGAFERFIKEQQQNKARKKVGRNDPCPCGSGRKYKHCCLNKSKTGLDRIESMEERQKCLRDYPEVGVERQEGREYLEDYFDTESIEVDRLLYLGLHRRPVPLWERNRAQEIKEENRKREYLWEAFSKFTDKCQKDNITDSQQYDEKYSIHYMCNEWLMDLLDCLGESGDGAKMKQVLEYIKKLDIIESWGDAGEDLF